MRRCAGSDPENKTMRVAFTLIDSARWTGGYNYLLNLFRSLQKYHSDQIRPVLFCGDDAIESDLQPFAAMDAIEIVRSPVFDRKKNTARLLKAFLFGKDSAALRVFHEHEIDVIFENATFYGWRSPTPAIAWMPDFQHRHLREQFGFAAYWRRELGFRVQVASGRILMLSSEDARKDCENFYRGAAGHTSVVRFAAPIPADLMEASPEEVLSEYGLPSRFFYLPNQFWKHKNHRVVVEALGILKQRGVEVIVAASGNPLDPRHPDYLQRLVARIEELGLQGNFRMLGLIPRRHVVSLMRTCTALINPSYFEGWSSTVEEARTLGVPLLLSDIAVHREQMNDGAIYFSPDDAIGLAEALEMFLQVGNAEISDSDNVSTRSEDQVERFASDFLGVATKAMKQS